MAGNAIQLLWSTDGVNVAGDFSASVMSLTAQCGQLLAQSATVLAWGNSYIDITAPLRCPSSGRLMAGNSTCITWSANGGCLYANQAPSVTWREDGAVAVAGPLTITGAAGAVENTSEAQLANGNPSTISSSITCKGDIVTLGGGVFVLSDRRAKRGILPRTPQADLEAIRRLEPIDFQYMGAGTGQARVGFAADAVEPLVPEAVRQTCMVVRDVTASANLVPTGVNEYRTDGAGLGDLGLVEMRCAGGLERADVRGRVVRGCLGKGGRVTVVGRVLTDGRCLDYQALAAVHLNATRALATQVSELQRELQLLKKSSSIGK